MRDQLEASLLFLEHRQAGALVFDHLVAVRELVEGTRFDLKFGMPGLTQETLMRNIELYGTQVIPRVRELRGDRQPALSSPSEQSQAFRPAMSRPSSSR